MAWFQLYTCLSGKQGDHDVLMMTNDDDGNDNKDNDDGKLR